MIFRHIYNIHNTKKYQLFITSNIQLDPRISFYFQFTHAYIYILFLLNVESQEQEKYDNHIHNDL